MAEKRIVVPEGMLKAANKACVAEIQRLRPGTAIGYATADAICICEKVLEAALRWLTENPIVPTREQVVKLSGFDKHEDDCRIQQFMIIARAWIEMMFLAPEPEVPEEIEDLLPFGLGVTILDDEFYAILKADRKKAVIEAFRRGQVSR